VPAPKFAKLVQNEMILTDQKITFNQAQNLKDFMVKSAGMSNPMSKIEKFICIDCKLEDRSFRLLLEGLLGHRGHIRSIKYSQNEMGEQCVEAFMDVISNLEELYLSNLFLAPTHAQSLLKSCYDYGQKLQKLSFSKINLNSTQTVEQLCELIADKIFLGHLDISWTHLSPMNLEKISGALMQAADNSSLLRFLDLSYNVLNFNDKSYSLRDPKLGKQKQQSNKPSYMKKTAPLVVPIFADDAVLASFKFAKNMSKYISESACLTHLDMSGMGLQNSKLAEDGEMLIEIRNLF